MHPNQRTGPTALLEGMGHADTLAWKKGKKLIVIIDEFSDIFMRYWISYLRLTEK